MNLERSAMGSDPLQEVQIYYSKPVPEQKLYEVKTVLVVLGAAILALQTEASWQNLWDIHTQKNDKSKDTLVAEIVLATHACEKLIKENWDLQSFQVQTFLWSQREFSVQKNNRIWPWSLQSVI